MRVWLLHIGEELPVDGDVRTLRYGYLAKSLQDSGHEVLRWAPTFRHSTKQHRFTCDSRVAITPQYAIQFVHSPGYARNASLARLHAYRVLGRRLRSLAENELPPDVIVAAIPSLEWAEAAIDYGRARGVPVIIDVRDLWPDVFLTALPRSVRRVGRFALSPYYRIARKVLSRADAITAVSETYLKWGIAHAARRATRADAVLPLGYEPASTFGEASQRTDDVLAKCGIDPSHPICLFAGIFEHSSNLETVIRAARRLHAAGSPAEFVFCGDGSKSAALMQQAAGLPNVHFPGWVDAAALQAIGAASTIGLCAYADDALQSLPNKPFEYMAFRLAIVSSLKGEMATILHRHQAGLTYEPGDDLALANSIASLLSDPTKLADMRERSHQTWMAHYRSTDIYARFVSLAEELAGSRRACSTHAA
jgi:glycosyltransferase involved in cell wall biosynthesis